MTFDRAIGRKILRFLKQIWDDAMRVDIFKDAYAMAYVTLLSLIPSLAAVFAVISLFTPLFGENSSIIKTLEGFIVKNLATGSGEQAIQYIEGFLSNTDFKKIGATGLVGTIVTLTLLLKQIEETLNRIFEVVEQRSIVQRFLYFWTFLTLGTFCVAVSLGTLSSFAWSSQYLDLSVSQTLVRDGFYMGGIFAFFLFMYKIAPNCPIPSKRAIIGSLVATVLLVQAIRFFSLYISTFTRYQAIYGALAALPIFLLWLYIIWLITFLGALITKRFMDGLPSSAPAIGAPAMEPREEYLRVVLPFLLLLKSYELYEAGKPCTTHVLKEQLPYDSSFVRRSLRQLVAADFLVCHRREEREENDEQFIPRMPASRLTYADVKKRLLGDSDALVAQLFEGQVAVEEHKDALAHYFKGSNQVLSRFEVASGARQDSIDSAAAPG